MLAVQDSKTKRKSEKTNEKKKKEKRKEKKVRGERLREYSEMPPMS